MKYKLYNFCGSSYELNVLIFAFKTDSYKIKINDKIYVNK